MTQSTLDNKTEQKVEKPKKYAVVILNDDFTEYDFVVAILMKFFKMDYQQAENITQDIHKKGKGVAGVYSHEIAETKVAMVMSAARSIESPLTATVEPEG